MTGARWLGFHLFAPEPHDALLTRCLAPLAAPGAGVRRFFFLRYGEGGPHLRLRVLPARGTGAGEVRQLLERGIAAHLPGGGWRLEAHPYDRAELYFGETRESVYAELLHEATTELALGLLRAPGGGDRTRRWLALAVLLEALLGGPDRDQRVAASRRFAREAAAAMGRPVAGGGPPPAPAADAALRRARRAMLPALAADRAVVRARRLLRRADRSGPRGAHVATHALHLLCNKLGFTLHEEHDLLTALARLGAEDPTPMPLERT